MTNFEYYKTQQEALCAYVKLTGDTVYNLGGGDCGTSAGRFVDWLYLNHSDKSPNTFPNSLKDITRIINRQQEELEAYRETLWHIANLKPELVGCEHTNPCDNSCAFIYGVKINGKTPTGCAKAIAQKVLDYFNSNSNKGHT